VNRWFRFQLALRAAGAMALALVGVSAITLVALRASLDRELDASILNVASIQAASLTDAPDGEMHFHEWDLTPDEAASLRDLIRYAQVWQADGVSLLRSQYMTSDLPLDREHLSRAGAGELVWVELDWEDLAIRSLYYPLERMGEAHQRHVLQIAAPMQARNELLSRVTAFLALLVVLLSAGAFAGAWWLAERAVRPVHEVIGQAEEIGAGSLDRRIQAYADTQEYRRLVEVLNTMLSRIHRAFEAQHRFTADASHELRSPLTAMRGELEIALRRERDASEYRRALESTLEEVIRLSSIAEDLLTLARSDSGAMQPKWEEIDLAEIVQRVGKRLRPLFAEKGSVLELQVDGIERTWGDPVLVGQVAWNLIDNAVKFTPPGGHVHVSVRRSAGDVTLTVTDDGPGFQSDPRHVFERFYRADRARTRHDSVAGTGLGLSIVKAAAEAHGGEVWAENLPGRGASVSVRFPHRPPEKPGSGE
jgi:two-component system OmpR family sensor kinase